MKTKEQIEQRIAELEQTTMYLTSEVEGELQGTMLEFISRLNNQITALKWVLEIEA